MKLIALSCTPVIKESHQTLVVNVVVNFRFLLAYYTFKIEYIRHLCSYIDSRITPISHV